MKKPGRGDKPPRGKQRSIPPSTPPVGGAAPSAPRVESPDPAPAIPASAVSEREASAPRPVGRLVSGLPIAALVVVAAFAIRRLDDFDTWWHLASGRWIAQHHSVPSTDVLSFTVPQNEWINLQWLYDLVLYWGYALTGASGLVLLSAACFVLTFAILAKHISRYAGPVTTTLLLVWVATTVNERFLIRPEMASFPLLAAIQLVLADGRSRPSRLKWLVPLMALWANMHSLFILGVVAIVCTMAGSVVAGLPLLPEGWRRDTAWTPAARTELFKWGGAGIAATLLNPYFVRALLFPIELMTRIDGSSPVYGVIGEFRAPFSDYFPTFAMASYQVFVFTFAGLAVAAGLVRAFARERRNAAVAVSTEPVGRFDLGAFVFAAALAYLSLLARRNVGVFAVGAVPFVGACAGILLAKLPRAAFAPAIEKSAAGLVVAGAIAICASVATNDWYAQTGETHEFGLGTFRSNFHPRASAFFREQHLPGPAFNDMTAGGYLTWDEPTGKGVYVDGRLEVYDTPFFGAYMQSLSNFKAWQKDADARGLQSVILFHRWGNRHPLIQALKATQDWKLVYYDETAVIFVRATSENTELIAKARDAFTATWRQKTEDELTGPPQAHSWQWAIDRYNAQVAYARLMETLGDSNEALKWFERSIVTGLPPAFELESQIRLARYYYRAGKVAQARQAVENALKADPTSKDAQAMLAQLDAAAKKAE